jgi:hypothetical protein
MDDASTAALLSQLAQDGAMPDLTVAYFADTDYRSHEVGPYPGLPTVERVDAALGEMFEAAGGMERFLRETCVLITSDHGHCEILADADRSVIRLDVVLQNFPQAEIGRPWRGQDEILICPNMRAAQIYLREPEAGRIERLAAAALADERIDQAMWRVERAGRPASYVVATGRGQIVFSRGGEAGHVHAVDPYGMTWSWSGAASALDLETDGRRLETANYPNAFERIAGALDAPSSGEVWLTAKPGCEFAVPGGQAHPGGGSHGALHALDSLSPVVMAGAPDGMRLPAAMRSVDIAPLCMQILGLPMRHRPGDPRP